MGRRPKTPAERERMREAILSAAEAVFSRVGFEGTRIEDVAAEAGVATGTVYNYFGGKGDLLLDLHARLDAQSNEAIAALVAEPGAFEDKLRRYMDGWLAFLDRTAWLVPLLAAPHAIRPSPGRAEALHRALFETHRRHIDLLATLMAQGIADRALEPIPPHDLAVSLFALGTTLLFKTILQPGCRIGPTDRDLVIRLFLDGARRNS